MKILFSPGVVLSLMVLTTGICRADDLTADRCTQLHQELAPKADEPWRTIPWQITVLEAQRLAAQQQKPIFIWAMDGHPLGCT